MKKTILAILTNLLSYCLEAKHTFAALWKFSILIQLETKLVTCFPTNGKKEAYVGND